MEDIQDGDASIADELPDEQPDEGTPEPATEEDHGGDEHDEGDGDVEINAAPAPKPESRYQKDVRVLRERAQKAEDDARQAQLQLVAARQPAAQPSREQVLWQQEDEVLNDPNADPWQKYSVNAARQSRHAQMAAQNALQRAEDLSDKTDFESIKRDKPKLYEKYAKEVETMLTDVRSKGNNAPRRNLLEYLIGRDMLAGKIKKPEPKKVSSARGQAVNARSDVSSTGGRLSAAEARAKRLENIRI